MGPWKCIDPVVTMLRKCGDVSAAQAGSLDGGSPKVCRVWQVCKVCRV